MNQYNFNFSNNLKLLRQTYHLSTTELANILGFKYNSTISEFERGKNTPSFSTLIHLANFFGITIDWLVGRSDTIYTSITVEDSENEVELKCKDIAHQFPDQPQSAFWEFYLYKNFPEYANSVDRLHYYSLPVRANIAVLIRLVQLPHLYWSMYYAQNGLKKQGIMAKVKSLLHISEAEDFKAPNRKELERSENLYKLLTLNLINGEKLVNDHPVYDIELGYQQLTKESTDQEKIRPDN